MKFTLSWLKDHLETEASLDEILFALTDVGLEVDGVENPAEKLSSFTIGHVKSAQKHPDADKLNVCQVETGEGDLQIICGAPNARAGINVVVAKPGTYIPGLDTTIAVGKIRGVESYGMMCSEREMELSDEHDGIIELDGGTVGQSFADYLEATDPAKTDPIIEIAITPNRPDALGVRGIARDLAARGLGAMKAREFDAIKGSFPSSIHVNIDEDTKAVAPVFYGRLIKGVKNGPSPKWLQDRLRAIGLRPISTLVDITNFFTYDRNRPLHVFDADKINGHLRVHLAKGGETLMGLDEKEYTFSKGATLISDDNGVQSIAGIMGGLPTGCTDETVNVFLEAAYFDPIATAMTGRDLRINSDARYRFERGIDPEWTPMGIENATQMILDNCGGEASEVVIAGEIPNTKRDYKFDPERTVSLVGMEIEAGEQKSILESLGFEVNGDRATVPSWRPDVLGDADLVEEIVRIKSLSDLEGQPMSRVLPGVPKPVLTTSQIRARMLRRLLAASGMNECVTYSFIDEKAAKVLGGGSDAVKLSNPISQDMSHLRPNLYAGLVQGASRNIARGNSDLALFEIGQGFAAGEPEDQFNLAAGVLVGNAASRNAFGTNRAYDVYDAKSILGDAIAALGFDLAKLTQMKHDAPWFHPGRSSKLGLGPKNIIAEFGELHPKVSKAMGVKGRVIAFAIFYDALPKPKKKTTTRPALIINDLQNVTRDFAFVVDQDVASDDLLKAIKAADKSLISDAILFDVFEGSKAEEQMGAGKKSLAVTVTLTPKSTTLTDDEINAVSQAILLKVEKTVGAVLRS